MATKKTIKKKEEEVVVTNPNETEVTEQTKEQSVEATETTVEPTEEQKPEENTEGETEVTVEPSLVTESVQNLDKPNVRIKTIKDYHCSVAGTMYYFERGKCYNVPSNIKMVLNKAGVLAVL